LQLRLLQPLALQARSSPAHQAHLLHVPLVAALVIRAQGHCHVNVLIRLLLLLPVVRLVVLLIIIAEAPLTLRTRLLAVLLSQQLLVVLVVVLLPQQPLLLLVDDLYHGHQLLAAVAALQLHWHTTASKPLALQQC
jgi:hypothetical protein